MGNMTGEDVKRRREARGMTQAELASAVGVTQPVISYIESEKRVVGVVVERALMVIFGDDIGGIEEGYKDRVVLMGLVRKMTPGVVRVFLELARMVL